MKTRRLHSWRLPPREAVALQQRLCPRVMGEVPRLAVSTIAGADVAVHGGRGFAAVVVLAYPSLEVVELRTASGPCVFPYVPGLLSFRELPVLLRAFRKLRSVPDVIVCDGQGIAHPRRFGLASHLGLILDHPTFGCAKSRLCGRFDAIPIRRGAWTPLVSKGETVGVVLCTRDQVRPVFVSVGHRISLGQAIDLALGSGGGYRVPEPTRRADGVVNALRRDWVLAHPAPNDC